MGSEWGAVRRGLECRPGGLDNELTWVCYILSSALRHIAHTDTRANTPETRLPPLQSSLAAAASNCVLSRHRRHTWNPALPRYWASSTVPVPDDMGHSRPGVTRYCPVVPFIIVGQCRRSTWEFFSSYATALVLSPLCIPSPPRLRKELVSVDFVVFYDCCGLSVAFRVTA